MLLWCRYAACMKPQHLGKAVLVAAVVLLVGVGAAMGAAAAADVSSNATETSSCSTIDSPGEYVLSGDVTAAPNGGCLVVTADDVTLDGNGHEIASDGASAAGPAVRVVDAENVSVRNVTLSGWQVGVAFEGVDTGSISDVRVSTAEVVGVSIAAGSRDVTVSDSDVRDGTDGVRVDAASGVDVRDNAFSALTGTAVHVRANATEATVRNNTVSDTSGVGVRVTGADDVSVVDNEVADVASHGIAVGGASTVTIERNRMTGVSGAGIRVRESPGTQTRDNVVAEALSGGIQYLDSGHEVRTVADILLDWPQLSGLSAGPRSESSDTRRSLAIQSSPGETAPRDALVTNNTVEGGYNHGVLVESTSGIIVSDNRVTRSDDGVHASNSSDVSVWRNELHRNLDDGVAFGRVSDGDIRANNATRNGDNGIYVVGNGNVIADNTGLLNGDDGFDIQNATGSLVRNNVAAGNADDGIFLRNANNGTLVGNTVRDNLDDGIHFDRSANNSVRELAACGNDDDDVMRTPTAEDNDVSLTDCESAS